ncbi:MAG: hypothetical protein IPP83_00460 [Flavobacteriales bacterium]|nr:hypothetical protein [Flavobacteriales bacterium]
MKQFRSVALAFLVVLSIPLRAQQQQQADPTTVGSWNRCCTIDRMYVDEVNKQELVDAAHRPDPGGIDPHPSTFRRRISKK